MNIEAFDLDKLRKLIRDLQKENEDLKKLLNENNIRYEIIDHFNSFNEYDDYDADQDERIIRRFITEKMANEFFYLFQGRKDVYAKRGKNGGYFPQCENRWNDVCPKNTGTRIQCEKCEYKKWKNLELFRIVNHLIGRKPDDVLGIYPLLADGTCRFMVFDFDNHEKGKETDDYANDNEEWKDEVNALRKICELNGIKPLVERSRSGRGAHVWILFAEPISARMARNFGFLLLDKGMSLINLRSFNYYDRMYPCQDQTDGIGNLIALPLQGDVIRNGNSVFVDEEWNAYPDQWSYLFKESKRITKNEMLSLMLEWQKDLAEDQSRLTDFSLTERPKPWKKNENFVKEDIVGKLHIVMADGIYVDTLNLMPRLQNRIRSMAAFDNPEFYKRRNMGYSNYYVLSSVYLGKDINGYINIPRGLKEKLISECGKSKIEYDVRDEREKGRPIRVSFKKDLRTRQDLAANDMFNYENGILDAATGFGKTVIGTYLIAKRKVNTLIILQSTELIDQWKEAIEEFIEIREELPTYKTNSGRIKTRESVVGELSGSKNTINGIIDIAMVGSLYKKGDFNDFFNTYGMVIVDECHHSASSTFVEVLKKINAKYVYGFSATLKRSDNLDKIIYMMIGPVRHQYTALQRSIDNGIMHYIIPRYTKVFDFDNNTNNINKLYELVCFNKLRNEQIISDVRECISAKKTPLILTKYKEHVRILYEELKDGADHVFMIYGDNTQKENKEIKEKLKNISNDQTFILIATFQKVGEGFDLPRLDVLFLAAPVSHESRLKQYVGRIDRIYKEKNEVLVYDYIDSHISAFDNMYHKRLRTYKNIGFKLQESNYKEKQIVNAIYDYSNYAEVFEQDLIETNKRIVISSPGISTDKVERLIYIMKPRIESGVTVSILTVEKDANYELIASLRNNGMNVTVKEDINQCFAIIDDEIVWHGGVNLLGKEDVWDNLIRIKDSNIAAELMEIETQ